MIPARQIRATWFACTVGTAAGCMVFDLGRKLLGADAVQLALFLVASTVGGMSGSRYTFGIGHWLPSLVIGFLMTVRLYDPFLDPPPDRISIEVATVVSGCISAYFGNSLMLFHGTARVRNGPR